MSSACAVVFLKVLAKLVDNQQVVFVKSSRMSSVPHYEIGSIEVHALLIASAKGRDMIGKLIECIWMSIECPILGDEQRECLPQKQMRGLAQRGGTVDANGGESNWSIARTGAYESLVVLTRHFNKTVGSLNDAKTIDIVHLGTVVSTTVWRFGNHLLCIRHEWGTVAWVAIELTFCIWIALHRVSMDGQSGNCLILTHKTLPEYSPWWGQWKCRLWCEFQRCPPDRSKHMTR